jgi:hypothetical protein
MNTQHITSSTNVVDMLMYKAEEETLRYIP